MKDDRTLVAQCREGDRDAFGELVRRYEKQVYSLILRSIGDRDEALDISQEAFLRAYRGMKKFRGGSTFKTWLYTITANLIKNRYRSKSRRVMVPLEEREIPIDDNGMENLEKKEMAAILRETISELPYKQRMALTLRIYDGLSHREIGEILDCSEGTVKVNFHHAVNNLRKRLVRDEKRKRNEL